MSVEPPAVEREITRHRPLAQRQLPVTAVLLTVMRSI